MLDPATAHNLRQKLEDKCRVLETQLSKELDQYYNSVLPSTVTDGIETSKEVFCIAPM